MAGNVKPTAAGICLVRWNLMADGLSGIAIRQLFQLSFKLLLLLWKNWTILKRNWVLTILEISLPVCISAIYIAIHAQLVLMDGDLFVHLVGPIFLALGFCFPVLNLVRSLVTEKEEGIHVT